MPDVTVEVTFTALESARTLTQVQRREVARAIESIAADPDLDNERKIPLVWPPVVFGVYRGITVWIVYHQVHVGLIRVMNVGRWSTDPAPR